MANRIASVIPAPTNQRPAVNCLKGIVPLCGGLVLPFYARGQTPGSVLLNTTRSRVVGVGHVPARSAETVRSSDQTGRRVRVSGGNHDGLLLGVVVEHFGAVLFAIAAVLGAAEGELVVGDLDRVDPGVAGFELVDGALGFVHVAGKDARAEAKFTVVGSVERFVEVLDAHDRQQRAERFLGPHAGSLRHVDDDGRLEKVTAAELLAGWALAARDDFAAPLDRVGQLGFDLGTLFLSVQGTHLRRRIGATAQLQPFGPRRDFQNELVGDALEHVDTLHGQTSLAGIEKTSDGHRARRQVEVRVVTHDGGIRATQLQGDVLELLGSAPGYVDTRARFAGEPDFAHERMADDLLADHAPRAGDDVQHTGRQTASVHQLGEAEGGQRRGAGRFDDDG